MESSRSLRLSGPENVVVFDGDVVATSGDEQLRADAMTLHLQTVESPAAGDPQPAGTARTSGLIAAASTGRFERKEPVRLVATNAVVDSASYAPDMTDPAVYSAIRAPRFEVDIPSRTIRTTGGTEIGLINRRLASSATGETASFGVPSGLLTRGPSQTAMYCSGPMTYVIGSADASRRDYALLEGDVVFRHLAGREMEDLERMMPGLARQPDKLAMLESRQTFLTCQRLETAFDVRQGDNTRSQRRAAGPPLSLGQLIAAGGVLLRDRQGDGVREVQAERLEYDAYAATIRVLGQPARVFYTNAKTGEFQNPAVSNEIEINLKTNQVQLRAPEIKGRIYQNQDD